MSVTEEYETLDLIGRGSFGLIRKVRRKSDGLILVRKEISYVRMSQKEREQLQSEFGILSSLKHPNIVQYYHRDHIKPESTIHLYMEYCGNGDLSRIIQRCKNEGTMVPESLVWSIFAQITMALYRCHFGMDPPGVQDYGEIRTPQLPKGAFTVLHRDIKPENVFMDGDNSVKLGDFGLSKILSNEAAMAHTYVGTPYYMSPELICDMPYTSKSDIWSLGCVIYELCSLSPPFNAKTHFSLCQKIKDGKFDPIPAVYSQTLQKVIAQCMTVNPERRPDTAKLLNLEQMRSVRKEMDLVNFTKQIKMREEQLRLRESALELKEKELQREFIERGKKLDADLRQKWAEGAEIEIQRRVQIELEQRLPKLIDDEVNRRLAERLAEFRPHTPTSLSNSTHSNEARRQSLEDLVPPSPMDIHMMSPAPSAFESPRRRSAEDSPFSSPLKRPALFPTQTAPLRPTVGMGNHHVLHRLNPDTSALHHTAHSTPNLHNLMGHLGFESPTKVPRKKNVLQPQHPNLQPHGMPLFAGQVKPKSILELAKEREKQSEVMWDPERDEMPSPFIKRTVR